MKCGIGNQLHKSIDEHYIMRVVHSLWKGNTHADFFTNIIFYFAGNFQYNYLEHIPNTVRKILYSDKISTPYIRRSKRDT